MCVDNLSEYQCRLLLKVSYDELLTFDEIKDWYVLVMKLRYTGRLTLAHIAGDSKHGNSRIRTILSETNKMQLSVFRNAIIEYNRNLGMVCFSSLE